MKKVIEAKDTLFEISDFFHDVAQSEGLSISKGMTIEELARKAGTTVPRSLRGAEVRSTSGKPSKPRKGQPVLTVAYEEPSRGQGVKEFRKCVDVGTASGPVKGTVKVCINCSLTKRRCEITIEITATIAIG